MSHFKNYFDNSTNNNSSTPPQPMPRRRRRANSTGNQRTNNSNNNNNNNNNAADNRRRSIATNNNHQNAINNQIQYSNNNNNNSRIIPPSTRNFYENEEQIRIKVLAGQSLAKKDIFGASDPYVRIDLNTIVGDVNVDSVLTKTKKKTLNPVWNEEFVFRVKPSEHKLIFQVFDENRLTRDDFLGMVEINLVNLPTEQEGRAIPPKNYPLRPRSARSRVRGTLEIYHAFVGGGLVSTTTTTTTATTTTTTNGNSNNILSSSTANSSDNDFDIIENDNVSQVSYPYGNPAGTVADPLPSGWEERQDANGRTYYLNHLARTTQWARPSVETVTMREIDAAATEFHRRFHISHDETAGQGNQHNDDTSSITTNDDNDDNDESEQGSINSEQNPPNIDSIPQVNQINDLSLPDEDPLDDDDDHNDVDNEDDVDIIDIEIDEEEIDTGNEEDVNNNNNNNEEHQEDAIATEECNRDRIEQEIESSTTMVDDTISLNSDLGGSIHDTSLVGSVNSINTIGTTRTNFTRTGSLNSNDQSNAISRPVRPAPPVPPRPAPRHSNRRHREIAAMNSRRNATMSQENGNNNNNNINNTSTSINNEEQSNSENEDADTSDNVSAIVNNTSATSPGSGGGGSGAGSRRSSSTVLTRQTATDETTPSSTTAATGNSETDGQANNLASDLPTGWSMQVAPNGRMFFIDHNSRKTSWVDPRTGRASPMPNQVRRPEDDLGPLPEGWEERVHADGRIFYIDHNTRTTQWEDPRLSNPNIAGQAVPYSRDYKQKYEYFKNQLKKPTNVPNKFEIKIRRTSILEDSYRILNTVTKTDFLKTKLWIEFEGEAGLDYGGLAREWFFLLSKEMFNPYYGLFEYSAMDNYTLQINPFSGLCNEEHLNYFKFIGKIAGMAVYHGKLLDAFFIRPFYKMMLQKTIDLKDMESVDMEYYNSLLWIKENDPSELVLTFCIDEETFGHTSQRELKPNGADIEVTNENKDEYIKLVIEWRFVARVKEQMTALLDGFGSICPLNLLKIFDENELELLMCGIQNIDVKDWKKNTLYKGDYYGNHIVVQWFWRAVLSFSNEMRSRLLQFVTGTSRVPMNGFKELYGSNGPQMFTIEKWGTTDNFPRAHTCFNRLDLPPYESYLQLKDKLVKAIEGSQGFAGVD